ncbi:MAG: hypothetical protein IID40_08230 [Planctomycetes bacterium]|nr:hypothetical protein [Planctomycetota bacterium]
MDSHGVFDASRYRRLVLAVALSGSGLATQAWAQRQIGQVTMLAGTPSMMGEAVRPLQAILSGRQLQTGPGDAAGLLVEDIVFHIGDNSKVTVLDEPGRKRIVVQQGYVVFYTDASTASEVVVETPFGRLIWTPGTGDETGRFSIRHDLAQANVSAAVSTFAVIDGSATAEGTNPVAGPHNLMGGQRWRIVAGQIPGPPEAGDAGADADALRDTLHRQAAEMLRAQTTGITGLVGIDLGGVQNLPTDVVVTDQQFIIDPNAASQDRATAAPSLPPIIPVIPEEVLGFAISDPVVIPTGDPVSAVAQFVAYAGTPVNENFNDFLTAVDGNPAFQPNYVTRFANGGFSYIQLAGNEFEVTSNNGETFLVTEPDVASGWAIFTPNVAVGDAAFDPASGLADVVTQGFQAVARGEAQAGAGTIGGDGIDPASGFAGVFDGTVALNPNPPAGYPLLDRANLTLGLTVDGEAVSDQIAALGEGLNPLKLDEDGPQLVFLSASDVDSLGNSFDFNGEPIVPTDLNLPGDRTVTADTTGAANTATPLAADPANTVGIQFAPRGEIVAVIHHAGLSGAAGTIPVSEHFEIDRGTQDSVIRWRDGQRVTGTGGEVLELENLNENPEVRNELFGLICQEANKLVPPDRHTLCGPATVQPGAPAFRQLRRSPSRLVRVGDTLNRHRLAAGRRPLLSGASRALRSRVLKPAGGRLLRTGGTRSNRRYIGRATVRN